MSSTTYNSSNWSEHDQRLHEVKTLLINLGRKDPDSLELLSSIHPYDLRDIQHIAKRS